MDESNETEQNELRIAVVGAGPAGVYSSDIFLKELAKRGEELGLPTTARIDLFEKLPVPFGLVRYGVAPDHPAIKFIAGALEKTLDNPNIHLYCDVDFGKDITLDDLMPRYDAVLFATGAVADKPLDLAGANLSGVYGAARFVEWYDGYPTGAHEWPLDATQVAVIGGGNVAMDVSRELMRRADDLKATTDIPDNVYEGIKVNKARELHLFIRRGVAQAKFSVQELRELEKLPGVQIIVNDDDFELDDDTIEAAGKDKLTRQMVEELYAVRDMAEDMAADADENGNGGTDFEGNPADKKYYIHFNCDPVEVLGADGKVTGLRVERTQTGADGVMRRTGEFAQYPVQAVYHAIGYKPASVEGVPYDTRRSVLANQDGRICTQAGIENGKADEVCPGLYATGWAKRGPVGLIGSTKSDALAIVSNMLEDLAASRGAASAGQGSAKAAETKVGEVVAETLRSVEDAEQPSAARISNASEPSGLVDEAQRTCANATDRDPQSIDRLLAERGVKPIDFAGWKRVDAYERAEGAKEGREHKKVVDAEQLRALAHGE